MKKINVVVENRALLQNVYLLTLQLWKLSIKGVFLDCLDCTGLVISSKPSLLIEHTNHENPGPEAAE